MTISKQSLVQEIKTTLITNPEQLPAARIDLKYDRGSIPRNEMKDALESLKKTSKLTIDKFEYCLWDYYPSTYSITIYSNPFTIGLWARALNYRITDYYKGEKRNAPN